MMIFRIVATTAIALASVAVLLSITGLIGPGFMGPAICGASQAALSIIPVSQENKPSLPSFCLPNERTMERIRLEIDTNKELAEKLAYYIDRCWASADNGRYATSFVCYEIYSDKATTEKDIVAAMELQGVCSRIGNNRIDSTAEAADCGTGNYVFVGPASLRDTIIVKYEANLHRISLG